MTPYRQPPPSAPSFQAADSYLKNGSIDVNYFGSASYTLVLNGDTSEANPTSYDRDRIDRIRAANTGHSTHKANLFNARDIMNAMHRETVRRSLAVDLHDVP